MFRVKNAFNYNGFRFMKVDLNEGEEDEMGGACSTNGGAEERVYVGGNARGKEEDQDVGDWIILRWAL
jgi:hypothetical protein